MRPRLKLGVVCILRLRIAQEGAGADRRTPKDSVWLPSLELLRRAARPVKPSLALKLLEQARRQIPPGTDPNAADSQGRTALHWATLGAMYVQSEKMQKAYVELAEQLIY